MDNFSFQSIGVVHSEFDTPQGTPIQAAANDSASGTIEIFPDFHQGLQDLEGFEYIYVLYVFDRAAESTLLVQPFLDKNSHGVFATRAPRRPNAIGISVLKLHRIENGMIYVDDLDMLNGTPVLDIKPFVPQFDNRSTDRIGWLKKTVAKMDETLDDGRFSSKA
jgi:tRNA-Thr(GGU) m(6)t(6)A37 methyltransferase TsaA